MTQITYPTIGLAGAKRSGKNTVADMLTRLAGYRHYAFADDLKKAALALDPIITYTDELYTPEPAQKTKLGWRTNYPVRRLSEIIDVIGWERAKDEYPEVRRTLQRLGTEAGWHIHGQNLWTKRLHRHLMDDARRDRANNRVVPVVLTDVRFAEEAEFTRNIDGLVIEVRRPAPAAEEPDALNTHASEAIDIEADHVIINDGTLDDLYEKVTILLNQLTGSTNGSKD